MSPARGGSRTAPEPDARVMKISLLDKWKWARAVVADHAIPREAMVTGFVVADLVDHGLGYAFAGQEHIAEAVGLSKTAVHGHIKRLATRGHLGVKRRGKLGANHYFLLQRPKSADGGPGGDEFKPDGIHNPGNPPDEFKLDGIHGLPKAADEFKLDPVMNSSQLDATKPSYQAKRETASPQPCDRAGREAGQADDVGGTAAPPLDLSRVASAVDRRRIDARWIEAAGPDLAGSLASDREGTDRLHDGIAAGRYTAEDVETAIVEFRRKHPDEGRRFWGFFETWAVRAAKARPKADVSTEAKPVDVGPTVAIPGHATARWSVDVAVRYAARWWNTRQNWFEDLRDFEPDKPDPRRSPDFQAALDAGRAEVVAAVAAWKRDPASWNAERLGPAPDRLGSTLDGGFGVPMVEMRRGPPEGAGRLLNLLWRMARHIADEAEYKREMVLTFRAEPSTIDAEDCTLPHEWQIKALEIRRQAVEGGIVKKE